MPGSDELRAAGPTSRDTDTPVASSSHSTPPTTAAASSTTETSSGTDPLSTTVHSHGSIQDSEGLSTQWVISGDQEGMYRYVSDSMTDILGYEPENLLGKSCYVLFHPDELPYVEELHYRSLLEEHVAYVAYMRLRHEKGHFVECCVSYSTVYDNQIGMYTRAEDGPRTVQKVATARQVIEVSPSSQGKYALKRWSMSTTSRKPQINATDEFTTSTSIKRDWHGRPPPSPRTAFFLDRFTDTCTVVFATNDIIVNGSNLRGQSFYSIVRPSDRPRVRQYVDAAKRWSPVISDEQRTGGHGYCRFDVLRIPDYPPVGEKWPLGNDVDERHMPGQEFIPVEGIFTASSDGVMCIIDRQKRPHYEGQ